MKEGLLLDANPFQVPRLCKALKNCSAQMHLATSSFPGRVSEEILVYEILLRVGLLGWIL